MVKAVYIHIPFCSYKCSYCDFTSLVDSPIPPSDYLNLLLKEARLYRNVESSIRTIYMGGGTPTLLKPEEIGRLLEGLSSIFELSSLEEVSVECNPETYRYAEFKRLTSYGVNRLSIGAQSFTLKGLSALGRRHTPEDTLKAFSEARDAGFESINLDLIYGYPGQRPEDVESELEVIERLRPEHISAYLLTPYEGTPMGLAILSGRLKQPREEELAEIYDRLWKGLRALGYERYEISNWSLPGKECRHNLVYWKGEEFLGLGLSAWGYFGRVRYGNTKVLKSYGEAVLSNKRPVAKEVRLSGRDVFEEDLMLRLRLKWGLELSERHLIPEHLMDFFEERDNFIGIKEEYMLLSNEIITEVLLYNSDRNTLEVKNG